ncbi:uncharacterized protein [Ptychodera flava]|uniref:uncharacterized protein n=1 Tax=Ptychodera flava TaxID=63121 RepID=UPI003969BE4E
MGLTNKFPKVSEMVTLVIFGLTLLGPLTSHASVLLNELNADNPSTDAKEYIELFNTADQTVSLENYVVVLYNGNGETAYDVITFSSSSSIAAKGFYLIGSSNVVPTPDVLLGDTNIIQNGIDAVALYYGDTSKFSIGMSVTNDSLVDAIVYDKGGDHDDSKLIDVLTPGQRTLHEDSGGDDVDESLSRCAGTDPLTLSQFLLTPHTPGSSNNCVPKTVILNELNADNPGTDQAEFIELYNTADSIVNLDNYVLVFYNGNDANRAYMVIALNGSIGANGYYVIGSALVDPMPDRLLPGDEHILQNGVDAVALYYGSPSLYTVGMTVTTDNLVDAIVYDNNGDHSDSLTNILTPGELTLHEDDYFYDFPDESLGRCTGTDPRILSQYWLGPITPGSDNNCSFPYPTAVISTTSSQQTSISQSTTPSIPVTSPIVINELNADNPGTDDQEFVELFNTENYQVQLQNYVLVFYTGSSDTAYAVIALPNDQTIPARGHFVVGSSNIIPTPDLILDGSISIQNGEDAVALYYGNPASYTIGMSVTNTGLIDAIVYDNGGQHDDTLTDVLTPGEDTLHEDSAHLAEDESLSRCTGTDPLKLSQFALTVPTPGATNVCNLTLSSPSPALPTLDPTLQPNIVINEFDVDASAQFIELYDGGVGDTILDGLVIALYDGVTSTVYLHYDLNGYKTSENGYFGIGTSQSEWTPDILVLPDLIKKDGINAIALYYTPASNVAPGTSVTNKDLVDALVYSSVDGNFDNHPLTTTLTTGQDVLVEDETISQEEGSFSRCRGWHPVQISSFLQTSATPRSDNNCTLPAVRINEVNVAFSGQSVHNYEFIELFDGGIGYQSLDGVLVVFYNGNGDVSYLTIDCTGYSTDADGYLIIAADVDSELDPEIKVPYNPQGFIQNGPDAVALHLAPPQQFPTSTPVTDLNLIDAVVYGTNDNPDLELLDALLPGQHQVNENSNFKPEDHSISRCECCQALNSSVYGLAPVTPRALSVSCTRNNETVTETLPVLQDLLRIYEVNADQEGDDMHEFIEIGSPYKSVSLDGIVLVLYSGGDDRSYKTIDLSGYQTNENGLFTLGSSMITPTPDVVVSEQSWIQNGPDAVALHKGKSSDFPRGTYVTDIGLIDAIVYGTNDKRDQELLDVLSPGQDQINEDWDHQPGDESIIRCYSNNAIDLMAFTPGHPSPGVINSCPLPPLVISEINVDQAGSDKAEYIEIQSLDRTGFPLNNLVVVLYNGKTDLSYYSIGIDGHRTDNNGLFLIGSNQVSVIPDLIINAPADGFIQNGPDAVAVYLGSVSDFPNGVFATNESLIDAIVYTTENDPPAQSLVDILTPDGQQVIEDDRFHDGDESINRCSVDDEVSIVVSHLSPKIKNICPLSGNITLSINEVGLVQNKNLIEVWDNGYGEALLDGYIIVVYNDNDLSIITFDLTGYTTNQQGYFVIGSDSSVQPGMAVDQDFLPMVNGGVAVYKAAALQFPNDTSATAENIVDAVVYSQQGNSADSLAEELLGSQGAKQVNSDDVQTGSNTISRCLSSNRLDSNAYVAGVLTPGSLNKCPVYDSDIIINEINPDQDGDDDMEFVELYDGGRGNTLLSYITLVMYNGDGFDSSYIAVDLDGFTTNADGYLVIGSANVLPAADIVLDSGSGGFLQDGPDAIAIHRAPATAFPYSTPVTDVSLLDAIVYSNNDNVDQVLLNTLTPGGRQVKDTTDLSGNDQSISRCNGNMRFDTSSYKLASPTPKSNNSCPSPPPKAEDIIINEMNADSPETDTHEFIELYDKGVGNTPLDGLILVFFNGADDDKSYYEMDLTGYRTNSDGFFVIGSDNVSPDVVVDFNFLQNGPDAAVLYNANIADFPRGTMATSDNMVDCIIYGTNDDQDDSLIAILTPGQIQVNENDGHLSTDESLSRCLSNDVVNLFAYIVSQPTPGMANNCTLSAIVINELNVDQPGVDEKEFIELYDGGRGYTSLDSLIIVLFNGQDNDKSYSTIPLQNYRTDSDGYFIIGSEGVSDYVDIIVSADNGFLQNGADAIALYRDDPRNFPDGTLPTQENLMDALVYGTTDNTDTSLVDALLPGQHQVDENGDFMEGDESISRCICCEPLKASLFGLGVPSPRESNNCTEGVYTPPPPVTTITTVPPTVPEAVINEVNPDNPSYDISEFIELYGPAGLDLSEMVVVLYNGNLNPPTSYYTIGLEGQKLNSQGFLVIGSVSLNPPPQVTLPDQDSGIIQNGADAVAVYKASMTDFPNGTPVTNKNLIDALVYTNDESKTSQALLDVLTPNSDIFVENDKWHETQDESINRCTCCDRRTSAVYALSYPSPGYENNCPSHAYSQGIQMRLVDADCEVWMSDDRYIQALINEIVDGVEAGCQCGFTPVYLQDSKIFCGSVVYQANMLAMSDEQLDYLFTNYTKYITETQYVEILGNTYTVDNLCVSDCAPDPERLSQGLSGGAIAGIVIAVLVSVVLVIAIAGFLYLKRHKSYGGLYGFEDKFKFSDACELDNIAGNGNTLHSFGNPVYDSKS